MQEHAIRAKSDAVRSKAKGIIVDTWQSQANLSLFLMLLVLTARVRKASHSSPSRKIRELTPRLGDGATWSPLLSSPA